MKTSKQKVIAKHPLANSFKGMDCKYVILDDKSKYARVIGRGNDLQSAWIDAANKIS